MRHLVLATALLITAFAAACDQGEEAKQPPAQQSEGQTTKPSTEPVEKPEATTNEAPSGGQPSTNESSNGEAPSAEQPSTQDDSTAAPSDNDMAEPQDETQPQ